jgi:uncharacterized protein YjbJ (UPF0337 family)
MSDANKDRAKGVVDQIRGRVEQTVGRLTGNRERQAQGVADQAKGKVEKGVGDLRDNAGEAIKGE